MINFSILISCVCLFLFIILCISVYFHVKHGLIIIRTQEAIEKSLDILDSRYQSINLVLEKPIFFDSIEIRQVISDIKASRDSILLVANILTAMADEEIEQEETVEDES